MKSLKTAVTQKVVDAGEQSVLKRALYTHAHTHIDRNIHGDFNFHIKIIIKVVIQVNKFNKNTRVNKCEDGTVAIQRLYIV